MLFADTLLGREIKRVNFIQGMIRSIRTMRSSKATI